MEKINRPTIGLALSGAGNRSSFYIGFLEVLDEKKIPVDFIAAMSGASLVSAAYACGTLAQFKQRILSLKAEDLKSLTKKGNNGGMYSLEKVEEELRSVYTKGQKFEDVRPLMSFSTTDIDTGTIVDLCIGDIAKAACASCTLPGVFKPVEWGNRTLVDGGILSQVPVTSLKKFKPDITIGINMRGTKNIFSSNLITFKRVWNFFKKILFVGEIDDFLNHLTEDTDSEEVFKPRGSFAVLGKSLDVVIMAIKSGQNEPEDADIMITPEMAQPGRSEFSPELSQMSYLAGRASAEKNLALILKTIESKVQETVIL